MGWRETTAPYRWNACYCSHASPLIGCDLVTRWLSFNATHLSSCCSCAPHKTFSVYFFMTVVLMIKETYYIIMCEHDEPFPAISKTDFWHHKWECPPRSVVDRSADQLVYSPLCRLVGWSIQHNTWWYNRKSFNVLGFIYVCHKHHQQQHGIDAYLLD